MRTGSPDFETLLSRLKTHDIEAFDILYRQTRERLYILANSIVKDSSTALDLVQEVFINFWERQIYLNIESSLLFYLLSTTRNTAYNFLSKQTTQNKLKDQYLGSLIEVLPTLSNLENEDLKKELESAISRLPFMAEKVFRLHYIENMSHAHISHQLKISKSMVSAHITRALRQLRSDLKKTIKK
jgi:RNA polymerase sigma-70 factor (family 1)